MTTLQDYMTDTQALLRDPYGLLNSTYQLTRWINQAREQVALDTGCIRSVVTGQAPFGNGAQVGSAVPGGAIPGIAPTSGLFSIAGQEIYPFAYIFQTGGAQNAGTSAIVDINSVAVSWGGSLRPVQNWVPWQELQAYGRSYNVGVFSYPFAWATSGVGTNNKLWLWPAPSVASEMECDCSFLPSALYSNDDFEAIPSPFRGAVKYYAARQAFLAGFRNPQAAEMQEYYQRHLQSAAGASDRGRVTDYYQDVTGW